MFSTFFWLILFPAASAFILGFIAHFFKTQSETQPEQATPQEPAAKPQAQL